MADDNNEQEEYEDPTRAYHPLHAINDTPFDKEAEEKYIYRMKKLLPCFPDDVLINWFYRHWMNVVDYYPLGFESLRFTLQTWKLDDIPGVEAMRDGSFFGNFDYLLKSKTARDPVSSMMNNEGKWPCPVIFFQNTTNEVDYCGEPLKRPWHLLEGHRRLSYLITARERSIAALEHKVWVVTKETS
jgi:hypothetical protein